MTIDAHHMVEAALVVLVPEVESLVGAYRQAHDPSAAEGMPAHITIDYPFLPGVIPKRDLETELSNLFARTPPIPFAFTRLARFPEVIYLPPNPDTAFKGLIDLVAGHFPDSPPYGGTITDIVPHLTIAQTKDQAILNSVERQLENELKNHLPMRTIAKEVWLMDKRSGVWEKRNSFQLGHTWS